MATEICIYILLFFAYSFIGWVAETLIVSLHARRFSHRGFLIGPYLPIYGTGALLVTLLLNKYSADPLALFFLAIITCGILEYLTSLIMEKLFHARWWDYSNKPFNINGRVCLQTLIMFGLASVVLILFIDPAFSDLFHLIPVAVLCPLTCVLTISFLVDFVISITVLSAIRKAGRPLAHDASEELSAQVRAHLATRSWRHHRLVSAFPHLQLLQPPTKPKRSQTKKSPRPRRKTTHKK